MNRTVIISIVTLCLLVSALLLFWKSVWLVSLLFIGIGYFRHRLNPIRHEVLWCVGIGLGGGIVEMILVNIGQAWTYTTPHILGIPLYMPIFWGTIAAAIVSLYEGLVKRR